MSSVRLLPAAAMLRQFPSAAHPVCAGCQAFCCKSRFGWSLVGLTDSDMADEVLVDHMKQADVLQPRSHKPGYTMRFEDGACVFLKDNKCSIYENRPEACRNVTCFSEHLLYNNGPVINRWKAWYAYMRRAGLHHNEDGFPNPRARIEHVRAIDRFYSMQSAVITIGFRRVLRVAYTLDGLRRVTTVSAAAFRPGVDLSGPLWARVAPELRLSLYNRYRDKLVLATKRGDLALASAKFVPLSSP